MLLSAGFQCSIVDLKKLIENKETEILQLLVRIILNNCPDVLLWKFSKDEMDSVEKNIKDIEKIPKTLNEVNNVHLHIDGFI